MDEYSQIVERLKNERREYMSKWEGLSPEIASAMLRRQQATAVVSARFKIVEGAVSMVQMALDELSRQKIVELDEERKAAMVSNLMVVLCSDKDVSPIVNTGTLNH